MLCEEAAKVQKQVIMDRVQERPPSLDWVQYKQWNCSNATFADSILAEWTPNLKSTKSEKQVTGSGLEDSGLAIAVIPPSQIPVSAFCTNTHVNKQLDQGALGMSDPCGTLHLALKPYSVSRINCLLSNFYFCAY